MRGRRRLARRISRAGDDQLSFFHLCCALTLGLFAFLLAPIPASASTAMLTLREKMALVNLHGTGGYQVALFGAVEGPHSIVTMAVTKGSSSADYTAPGTITPTAIHASFGKLGKVALGFRSFRVQHARLPKQCRSKGSPAVRKARVGLLVGTVRFRGENDYTHLSAHRVKGGIGEWPAILASHRRGAKTIYFCAASSGHGSHQPPHLQSTSLYAHTAGEAIIFSANTEPEPGPAGSEEDTFLASVGERHGQVKISRSASAIGPAAGFLFDNALSTATLTPPAPFTGTAAFQRGPDGSTSWTGSLTVPFPGRGPVTLAGPAFKASLNAE